MTLGAGAGVRSRLINYKEFTFSFLFLFDFMNIGFIYLSLAVLHQSK